ncbi:hypothetical protein [Streptomyces sp. NPDC059076]|uniref:hypothetical protein n=1 Tax=unclassified Streptomyces TaxID=2593676 RepID=UPI0036A2A2E4
MLGVAVLAGSLLEGRGLLRIAIARRTGRRLLTVRTGLLRLLRLLRRLTVRTGSLLVGPGLLLVGAGLLTVRARLLWLRLLTVRAGLLWLLLRLLRIAVARRAGGWLRRWGSGRLRDLLVRVLGSSEASLRFLFGRLRHQRIPLRTEPPPELPPPLPR